MADSLVGLDSGGCVTPIANGAVGQVLTIGAGDVSLIGDNLLAKAKTHLVRV